jgi:hypothetical protein
MPKMINKPHGRAELISFVAKLTSPDVVRKINESATE